MPFAAPWLQLVATAAAISVAAVIALVARHLRARLRGLEAREEQLLALLDNLEDSVVAVGPDRRIIACNSEFSEATEKLAGIRAGPGVAFDDLVLPENRGVFDDRLRRVEGGEGCRALVSFQSDQGPVHREIRFRALWRDGVVVGFTFEGRDVTARREAERRLREANRQLVDLSREAGMAQVATAILHDAGNVLNSINVAADQIAEGLRDLPIDGVAKAARRLEASGERELARYLDRLHDLQRDRVQALGDRSRSLVADIEHIKAVISAQQHQAGTRSAIEPTSIEDVADTALGLWAEKIQSGGITVERDYDGVGVLEMDRHRVLQILGNLVDNACDALSAVEGERRLRVRTRLVDREARVEVEDGGIGIPPSDLRRIFEHGFTTKEGGHGFGLHASANAAGQMGGRMTCTSPGPGRGACFTLTLPATRLRTSPAPPR